MVGNEEKIRLTVIHEEIQVIEKDGMRYSLSSSFNEKKGESRGNVYSHHSHDENENDNNDHGCRAGASYLCRFPI